MRWRRDGTTNATTTTGQRLMKDQPSIIVPISFLTTAKFIGEAAGAKLNVIYEAELVGVVCMPHARTTVGNPSFGSAVPAAIIFSLTPATTYQDSPSTAAIQLARDRNPATNYVSKYDSPWYLLIKLSSPAELRRIEQGLRSDQPTFGMGEATVSYSDDGVSFTNSDGHFTEYGSGSYGGMSWRNIGAHGPHL